jgi:hypothetical protein
MVLTYRCVYFQWSFMTFLQCLSWWEILRKYRLYAWSYNYTEVHYWRDGGMQIKLAISCSLTTTPCKKPITVAAPSMAWTVFASLYTEIVGSNPTQGMDIYVRLFGVCVVVCVGSGLAAGWSPVPWVLPTVYKIKKLQKRPRFTRTVDP